MMKLILGLRRETLILLAVLLLLAGASISPELYDLAVFAAYGALTFVAAQNAVYLLRGHCNDALSFLGGLGGLLFLFGAALTVSGLEFVSGRDVAFLVRLLGVAFLVLPLILHRLPRRVQTFLGVTEGC